MELFKAHHQWRDRPPDERFKSVKSLNEACIVSKQASVSASVPFSQLKVLAHDDNLVLEGASGVKAGLTHFSMGQLAQRASAPAGYLRSLPTELAARNLNHGLETRAKEDNDSVSLLFHQNGSLTLKAATSEKYSRIWNADITERLVRLQENNPNWVNPMAYANGQWGAEMEPAGLYASDHDMFAFLVDESKTLEGSPQGLKRGFFMWNSEVGAASFGIMTFLYDMVCGNNIVWGAKNVCDFRVRHVGSAPGRAFEEIEGTLRKYSDSSSSDIEAIIQSARKFSLGANKEEALEKLLGFASKLKAPELNQVRLVEALDVAEKRVDRYGEPTTLWAAISGLTEASQNKSFTDERVKIDRAAGKLLKVIEF